MGHIRKVGLMAAGIGVCLAAGGSGAQTIATVTVETAEAGAAISPYVYGQFIEHLGRCIRDGIWAEMLYDRKFLMEPGKTWNVVKPEGAAFDVYLDTAGAYAAPHAMALWARDDASGSRGVMQAGIGLKAGREYVGYVVARCVTGTPRASARIAWPGGERVFALDGLTAEYRKFPFRFRAETSTDDASLAVTLESSGCLWLAAASLMPADNVRGMRADTLALIRKLDAPIYRWPGGNFVSGYDWKDGIGDRDRRPPRWERAWNAVEDNDFGLDEFLDFCREVKTEPMVVVNTGLGSVEDAAGEVEYANGAPSTRWGAERAKNGHRKPYNVVWWGVGNEMFGDWQLGFVPYERYAMRHNAFVDAMRRVDSRLKYVGVGAPGAFNDAVVGLSASHMDLLSAHHYATRHLVAPFTAEDAAKYQREFPAYSDSVAAGIRDIVRDLERRRNVGSASVDALGLCVDEWGIVRDWNPAPDKPGVGAFEHYYTMGDAVAVARGLHEMLRRADLVTMACWAQTVNVIGAIKTSRTDAAMDPVGHLLALYRKNVGGRVTPVRVPADLPVDAVAAWDAPARTLAVGLVNYSPDAAASLALSVPGAKSFRAWRIHGDLTAINVPGEAEGVSTVAVPAPAPGEAFSLPAHSITVITYRM